MQSHGIATLGLLKYIQLVNNTGYEEASDTLRSYGKYCNNFTHKSNYLFQHLKLRLDNLLSPLSTFAQLLFLVVIQSSPTHKMDRNPQVGVIAGIPPPFLRLPYEIRLIIYNYCLLVDYDLIPYLSLYRVQKHALKHSRLGRRFLKDRHSTQPPSSRRVLPFLNLLAVNKQVHEETAPILYGKNTWRMPVISSDKLWRRADHNVFIKNAKHFQHITIKLHWRELADSIHDGFLHHKSVNNSEWFPQHRDRAYNLALWQKVQTRDVLDRLYRNMSLMMPHLTSLVIDVDKLYCSLGCCRDRVLGTWLRKGLISSLGKGVADSSLTRTEFKGLKSTEEKEMVYGNWGFEESGIVSKERLLKRWAGKHDKKTELDVHGDN